MLYGQVVSKPLMIGDAKIRSSSDGVILKATDDRVVVLRHTRGMLFSAPLELSLIHLDKGLNYIQHFPFPEESNESRIINIIPTDTSVFIFYHFVPNNASIFNKGRWNIQFVEWGYSGTFISKPTNIISWKKRKLKEDLSYVDFTYENGDIKGLITFDKSYSQITRYQANINNRVIISQKAEIIRVYDYQPDSIFKMIAMVRGKFQHLPDFKLFINHKNIIKEILLPLADIRVENISLLPTKFSGTEILVQGYSVTREKLILSKITLSDNGEILKKEILLQDHFNSALEKWLPDKKSLPYFSIIGGRVTGINEIILAGEFRSEQFFGDKELKISKFSNSNQRNYKRVMDRSLWNNHPYFYQTFPDRPPTTHKTKFSGPSFLFKIDSAFTNVEWHKTVKPCISNFNFWEAINSHIDFSDTSVIFTSIFPMDLKQEEIYKYSVDSPLSIRETEIDLHGEIKEKSILEKKSNDGGMRGYRVHTLYETESHYYMMADNGSLYIVKVKKQ